MIYGKCRACGKLRVPEPHEDSVTCCSRRSDMKELKLWQVEFVYAKKPNLKTGDLGAVAAAAETVDWHHQDAEMFKYGWDACLHCVGTSVQAAIHEAES